MWPDNETVDDLIGFKVHADLIRSVVTDDRLLPATVGVFGDWGNGKTSIMHMLRHDLDPENTNDPDEKRRREKIAVLYFNGWLFEGYDDAKSALLSSILQQLKEHKRFGPRIAGAASALLKRVDVMRVLKLGWRLVGAPALSSHVAGLTSVLPLQVGAAATVLASGLAGSDGDDKGGLLKPSELTDAAMDIRSFRDEFAKMLKDSDIASLVVLIDDLDRCSPDTIIDNLEAIKLFLNVPNTAFVIGADRRIVRHAIAVRYKDTIAVGQEHDDDMRLADDYLEKLIQIPYSLPQLSPAEIETYITLLFCHRDLSVEQYGMCVRKCDELRAKNRFRAFGMSDVQETLGADSIPSALHSALSIVAVAASMITECLNGNPRQVKRFLNAYTLRRKLATVARMDSLRDDVLIKLMLLEYAEFPRFKELAGWQETERGFPKQLKAAENTVRQAEISETPGELPAGWGSERVRHWFALAPPLSEVDLSDYFWLARDKLASTMSGLTMVPPVVRRMVESMLNKATRPSGLAMIRELSVEDFRHVHDLLGRNIQRQPENNESFQAYRELVAKHPESGPALAETLQAIPVEKYDASWPGQLQLLLKQHAELPPLFAPVFEHIQKKPATKAARALNTTTKKR